MVTTAWMPNPPSAARPIVLPAANEGTDGFRRNTPVTRFLMNPLDGPREDFPSFGSCRVDCPFPLLAVLPQV
jgi:hypothetical protein